MDKMAPFCKRFSMSVGEIRFNKRQAAGTSVDVGGGPIKNGVALTENRVRVKSSSLKISKYIPYFHKYSLSLDSSGFIFLIK